MPPLIEFDTQSFVGTAPAIGVVIALVGAVFLSLGAQFQHRGVEQIEEAHGSGEKAGLSVAQLLRLLARPWWVLGTVMLGLAILFQLTSLTFAPIIVVQPLGVVALVVTAIVNARVSGHTLDFKARRAVALCVGGIALFVVVAAFFATEHVLDQLQLLIVLGVLAAIVVALGAAFVLWRKRAGAIFYILAAGVLYGFVATLAKAVINRVGNGNFEWLTIVCVVALLAAAALGGYFVQTAYSVGAPDLVIAGLTVVDPLVAVVIGITVFGEASEVPAWVVAVWIVAGAVAVAGVFQLARHHPQTYRQPELG